MVQVSGLPFKLVYSNWYTIDNIQYPLPNGLHPALVNWMQDQITTNNLQHRDTDFFRIKELDDLYFYNNPTSGFYFRNSNFFYHFKKDFGLDNIVSEKQIDNGTYYYPIELECNTTQFILNKTNITVDGIEYEHSFAQSLTPTMLDLLQTGRVKLLLTNLVDPSSESSILKEVEELMLQLGIKGSNIVFLQGSVLEGITTDMTLLDGDLAVYQTASTMDRYPFDTGLGYVSDYVRIKDIDSSVVRSKRFLSFNRMPRPHRVALCQTVVEHDLLKDGYFSFLFDARHDTRDMLDIVTDSTEQMVQDVASIVPYHLDTQHLPDEQRFSFFPVTSNKKDFYIDSYVHLTTETGFVRNESPFFSEKTWRPILNLQPFIYLGNCGALNKLQQMGFKTFHPYIDETYDTEQDIKKRFALIKQEILKIANMPMNELHDWYYSMISILMYNQHHLYTFRNYNPLKELLQHEQV